jgi:hypothetical protein
VALIGERFYDGTATDSRCVRAPAAATSAVQNGHPLDAGTQQILHNNLSHVVYESCRHLAWDTGFSSGKASGHGYSGLTDTTEPASYAGLRDQLQLSWDRRTGRQYGPWNLVADRALTTPHGYTFRKIRLKVEFKQNTSPTLVLYAALMPGGQSPALADPIAMDSHTASGTAVQTVTLDLDADAPPPGAALISGQPCRNPVASITPYVTPYVTSLLVSVWLGWDSSDASNEIRGISIFETRAS